VESTLGMSSRHISMDAPFSDSEDGSLLDVLANENAGSVDGEITNKQSLKTEIDRILNVLTDKQRKVIRMYFGLGYEHAISLEDIGASFDLTRERVRQIKDKAISRLQSNNQCHLLKYFLG